MASLGPEQTNTRSVYVGTEASDHARSFGPRVSSIAVFFLTQIFRGDNILGFIFSPSVPSVPQRDFCGGQKAEPGSGANGYYMDPGRGAERQPGLQTRIANARATSAVFLRSNKICSDNPCHGSWQRQQLYAGRSCLDPAEGGEFLSVTGQQ